MSYHSPAISVLKEDIERHKCEWERLTDQINQKTREKREIERELEILTECQREAWYARKLSERALEVLDRS